MAKLKQKTEKQIAREAVKEVRLKAREIAKSKKLAKAKIDGEITADEIDKLRKAIRQQWQWSSIARKKCLARATDKEGFGHCESKKCRKLVPKLFVDHIEVMGDVLSPSYIIRMWCHSSKLQALCKKCHDVKTKEEREVSQSYAVKTEKAVGKDAVKTVKSDIDDFF